MTDKTRLKTTDARLVLNKPYQPFIREYSLISEFNLMAHHRQPGVYVIPAAKTPFVWFGVIFVRGGPYMGGVFRFRLEIPSTFPDCDCGPDVILETRIFHPCVDEETGRVKQFFKEWRKDVSRLWQVVRHTRQLLYNIDTKDEGVPNENAFQMFKVDRAHFLKLAKECAEASKLSIYERNDDDPNYLQFDSYDRNVHETIINAHFRPKIQQRSELHEPISISWVQPGSLQPLSRQDAM